MIVKGSIDTGPCYRVKKCAEIAFRKDKIMTGILLVFKEKIGLFNLNKNEICIFPGDRQADKINVKQLMERVKKEIRAWTN